MAEVKHDVLDRVSKKGYLDVKTRWSRHTAQSGISLIAEDEDVCARLPGTTARQARRMSLQEASNMLLKKK